MSEIFRDERGDFLYDVGAGDVVVVVHPELYVVLCEMMSPVSSLSAERRYTYFERLCGCDEVWENRAPKEAAYLGEVRDACRGDG